MKNFLYEWCPPYQYSRWWHGHVFARLHTGDRLMVIVPLHLVIRLLWYVNYRYTWIDRELRARLAAEVAENRPPDHQQTA